jgi:hypothetical protein
MNVLNAPNVVYKQVSAVMIPNSPTQLKKRKFILPPAGISKSCICACGPLSAMSPKHTSKASTANLKRHVYDGFLKLHDMFMPMNNFTTTDAHTHTQIQIQSWGWFRTGWALQVLFWVFSWVDKHEAYCCFKIQTWFCIKNHRFYCCIGQL